MSALWITLIIIPIMFVIERILVGRLTKLPGAREWVIKYKLFHPNAISIIRLPTGLLAIWFWTLDWHVFAVLWIAFWMISDLTDGTIARNCDLITETGKWLDPLSDKALYIPPLLFFAWQGLLPFGWIIALILIDCVGQASRLVVAKTAANLFGKTKTALITLLMGLAALHSGFPEEATLSVLHGTDFQEFLVWLTISCTVLAFLSFYCKIIPDRWYANSLSLANFGCGVAAIVMVLQNYPGKALMLIFLGQFFDLFDGRMARKYGSTTHGDIMDDIADGTSFGIAAGLLICSIMDYSALGWLVTAIFFAAVVFRLVRFTCGTDKPPAGMFRGMPSPAGALLAINAALLLARTQANYLIAPVVLVTAMLMISRILYHHFAQSMWKNTPNLMKVVTGMLILLMASRTLADKDYATAFQSMLLVLALCYTILGCDQIAKRIPGMQQL